MSDQSLSTKTSSETPFSVWRNCLPNGSQWNIYCGDAREVLKIFNEQTYNCVVTSPPYFWLRDYGVDGQIGLEQTVTEYVKAITTVMKEVYRVLRDDGVLFLNIGDTYYSGKGESQGEDPKSKARRFGLRAVDRSGGLDIGIKPKSIIGIPWRVALAMESDGWILRSPIIWNRKHCLPESVQDRPRRSYEYVFLFAKSRKYYFNKSALEVYNEEDIWEIAARPKSTNGIKTAPYPDELVQRCLDVGCPPNGFVLDPFLGSGTSVRVAINSGRSATGIDISKEFCDYVVDKLSKSEV